MSAGKIIAYIAAAIFIIFGALFILATFSPDGQFGWLITGLILVGIGFVLIWFAARKSPTAQDNDVTLKIDLSGDINLETLKCKSCGGSLTADNITMLAGAPTVNCPFCNTTYQLTEEPKW
jgi:Na+/melibiose symporter-like transporter